jgi:hypothetical protein
LKFSTEQELNTAAASLSKVLAGPIADGLLKVLMVGAGKGAGKVAGEFHKRYQFQLPNGIKNGSRLNSGPPVPKIVRRKPQKSTLPNSGPSAKSIHDKFVNQVRPGAKERKFDTPWSKNKGLGCRKFDDFDDLTKTGFEGNTTPWGQMTLDQLSRKLDQVGSDFALLQQRNGPVKRIIWFGTEPLPTTGLGGQLREALEKTGIRYWVIKQ